MNGYEERADHELKLPMEEGDWRLVRAYRDAKGLSNFGLGKELADATRAQIGVVGVVGEIEEIKGECFILGCGRSSAAIVRHPQRGAVKCCSIHAQRVARLFDPVRRGGGFRDPLRR